MGQKRVSSLLVVVLVLLLFVWRILLLILIMFLLDCHKGEEGETTDCCQGRRSWSYTQRVRWYVAHHLQEVQRGQLSYGFQHRGYTHNIPQR